MIDPDDIARAARRVSAKMVADQAVDIMMSMVGVTGDPEEPKPTERFAVVVVARGSAAVRVMDWIDSQQKGRGPASVEIEPAEDPPGYCSKHKQQFDPAGCCGECERDGYDPEDA